MGVIAGHDLRSDGNRQVGRDIYISTGAEPVIVCTDLMRGRSLRVDEHEHFPHCDLCCLRHDERIVVVVTDHYGHELSRRLSYPASSDGDYDEARFLWFGPQEALCTPWHDGEPQCQVITVDLLRTFAAQWLPTG